jgi:hypothetical protein
MGGQTTTPTIGEDKLEAKSDFDGGRKYMFNAPTSDTERWPQSFNDDSFSGISINLIGIIGVRHDFAREDSQNFFKECRESPFQIPQHRQFCIHKLLEPRNLV